MAILDQSMDKIDLIQGKPDVTRLKQIICIFEHFHQVYPFQPLFGFRMVSRLLQTPTVSLD